MPKGTHELLAKYCQTQAAEGSPQTHPSKGDIASDREVCRPASAIARVVTCAWLLHSRQY